LAGDFAGALALMESVGGEIHRVGGSHAQWELFEETMVVCQLRLGRLDEAIRLLSRRLVKREVRLHPVTVVLSLLVGGTLLGLSGMLLAVPTAAVLKVAGLYVWDTRSQWPPPMAAPAQDRAPPSAPPTPSRPPPPEPPEAARPSRERRPAALP